MNDGFLTYQKFLSLEASQGLLSLLQEHNIPYETVLVQPAADPSFAFNEVHRHCEVKLRGQDFPRVHQLEEQANEQLAASVDPDHYLFRFTDDELMGILVRPDEWSKLDFVLAQRILRDRGHDLNPDTVQLLLQHRNAELAKPEEKQPIWIMLGYVSACVGGLLGIIIGWHLYSHKRTLPNGETVQAFSADDRVHGLRITILGVIFLILWAAGRLLLWEK
ncbi:hypothetical protein [Hymenobacter sp. B81]|uniref:hypothetical protein n=1 Tax=Hymenobacter sp. B81 TaxID=3344878 RepID=UPI0037DD0188